MSQYATASVNQSLFSYCSQRVPRRTAVVNFNFIKQSSNLSRGVTSNLSRDVPPLMSQHCSRFATLSFRLDDTFISNYFSTPTVQRYGVCLSVYHTIKCAHLSSHIKVKGPVSRSRRQTCSKYCMSVTYSSKSKSRFLLK